MLYSYGNSVPSKVAAEIWEHCVYHGVKEKKKKAKNY